MLKDIVKPIVPLDFLPVADQTQSPTGFFYDSAYGTSGMRIVAEGNLRVLAE